MSPAAKRLGICYLLAALLVAAGAAWYSPGAGLIVAGICVAAGATAVVRDWTPRGGVR